MVLVIKVKGEESDFRSIESSLYEFEVTNKSIKSKKNEENIKLKTVEINVHLLGDNGKVLGVGSKANNNVKSFYIKSDFTILVFVQKVFDSKTFEQLVKNIGESHKGGLLNREWNYYLRDINGVYRLVKLNVIFELSHNYYDFSKAKPMNITISVGKKIEMPHKI